MTIGASWLLVIFAIVFVAVAILAVVHLFHAWRFGEHTPLAAITSGLFLVGIFAVVGTTYFLLRDVDWGQTFELALPEVSLPGPVDSSLE